jgi:hypothetical protein
MKEYQSINEQVSNRDFYTSFDESTYYTIDIFNKFCETRDLKRVAIFGYYKSKYRWTDAEAEEMYAKSPDGWTDGQGIYRLYDWGKGENQIKCGEDWDWHWPQLDHIVPKSRAKLLGWSQTEIDHPSNFQVLPAILNRVLNNMTDEQAPALVPLILKQFGM